MKVIAPAKLNLFLHITGCRQDHFHLLESLFVFTKWGDEITISKADTLSLTVEDTLDSALHHEPIENNLVFRAALLLKNQYKVNTGAHIHLTKKIPVAAGLGGGSSDAASTLKALNQLWDLQLSNETLAKIGLKLGADIPACIYQCPAFISGIGEHIQPINLSFLSLPVLLVNPNQPLSTQSVFHAYQKNKPTFHASVRDRLIQHEQNWPAFKKILLENSNHLALSATTLLPSIKTILATLQEQTGCELARMSGSGPTCFAIFSDQQTADHARKKILTTHPDFWVLLTAISAS